MDGGQFLSLVTTGFFYLLNRSKRKNSFSLDDTGIPTGKKKDNPNGTGGKNNGNNGKNDNKDDNKGNNNTPKEELYCGNYDAQFYGLDASTKRGSKQLFKLILDLLIPKYKGCSISRFKGTIFIDDIAVQDYDEIMAMPIVARQDSYRIVLNCHSDLFSLIPHWRTIIDEGKYCEITVKGTFYVQTTDGTIIAHKITPTYSIDEIMKYVVTDFFEKSGKNLNRGVHDASNRHGIKTGRSKPYTKNYQGNNDRKVTPYIPINLFYFDYIKNTYVYHKENKLTKIVCSSLPYVDKIFNERYKEFLDNRRRKRKDNRRNTYEGGRTPRRGGINVGRR